MFADLDGDGDPDLVAARNTGGGGNHADARPHNLPTTVFENEGDGSFRTAAGPREGQPAAVAVLDVDGDGRLDLFVAADGPDASSALLHNDGDLHFSDAKTEAPTGRIRRWGADLTGDGHADLVIAGANRVFHADGEGRFDDVTPAGFDWKRFGDEDLVTSGRGGRPRS